MTQETINLLTFSAVCMIVFYIALKFETKRHNDKMDKIVNDQIEKIKREQSSNNGSNYCDDGCSSSSSSTSSSSNSSSDGGGSSGC